MPDSQFQSPSKNSIRLVTGKYIDVFNLNEDDIDLEAIARGCAHEARWGGQTKTFYSVAEHCIGAAELVPPYFKLDALLHDASEGLGLRDMPKPIKNAMPEYKKIEDGVMCVVAKKFGIQWPIHPLVKAADEAMLQSEWDKYILGNYSLVGQNPTKVYLEFMDRTIYFMELKKQHQP